MRFIPCLLGLAALASSASLSATTVNHERIINADHNQEIGNWMTHGRTYGEQRYSPLDQINDQNVDRVGLAWTRKLDVDFGNESTPLVVDGVMYTTSAFSVLYALDAATGELLWKYDPEVPMENLGQGCCGPVNRGVAVWNGKVGAVEYIEKAVLRRLHQDLTQPALHLDVS